MKEAEGQAPCRREFEGKIFSGEGIGRYFVEKEWAKKQFAKKLGFSPYPGTLNIRLEKKEANILAKVLEDLGGIEITPSKGFLRALCFTAIINCKVKGAIVKPDKPDYPPNVIEILAPVCLRETLSLQDGDTISISVL